MSLFQTFVEISCYKKSNFVFKKNFQFCLNSMEETRRSLTFGNRTREGTARFLLQFFLPNICFVIISKILLEF